LKAELIENRIIVWNISDSKKLFSNGYFGKPIGMPKPKPDEINVPLILDLIEGCYLQLKSKIQIYKNKKKISKETMSNIVSPGIKFGCDFAVYQKGPGIDHAPFLVQVYNRNENITSTDVVLAGRLATSVKKQFILAIPYGKERVDYLALDWWKA
jgi:tRNA-intron endonuclease